MRIPAETRRGLCKYAFSLAAHVGFTHLWWGADVLAEVVRHIVVQHDGIQGPAFVRAGHLLPHRRQKPCNITNVRTFMTCPAHSDLLLLSIAHKFSSMHRLIDFGQS